MYVVYYETGVHMLIPLAKIHFERISEFEFVAMPVYVYESLDGVRVWPKPAKGYTVCKLVAQDLLED